MKRISLAFVAAVAFAACGDNSGHESGTGGAIESESTTPSMNSTDNNGMQSDTALMDTNQSSGTGDASGAAGTGSEATGTGVTTGSGTGAAGSGSSTEGSGGAASQAPGTGATGSESGSRSAGAAGGATSPATDNNQSK